MAASYTDNFNLKKPAQTDNYDIEDANGNMDLIDSVLKEHSTQLNEITNKISAIRFFSVVVDPNGQNSVNVVLSDIKSSSIILAINGDYTAAVEYVVGIKVNDGSLVVYLNTARTGLMRINGIYSI